MRERVLNLFLAAVFILYSGDLSAQSAFQKVYGGTYFSTSESVRQTSDSGFIFVGYTAVPGGGTAPDGYLVKTDSNGNMMWNKTFGGIHRDYPKAVRQSMDGGYIVSGFIQNNNTLIVQAYVAKMDNVGNLLWDKQIGSGYATSNSAHDVELSNDSSFIVAGSSKRNAGDNDGFLFKVNASGTIAWGKHYGGVSNDFCASMCSTNDGGYLLAGTTGSFGLTNYDIYIIKTDSLGNFLWSMTYGDGYSNSGVSVQQTADSGFIILGYTTGSVTNTRDILLIKTDSMGTYLWNKIFSGPDYEMPYSVCQTSDQGYIISGSTRSFGSGVDDVFLIRTDVNGDTVWTKVIGSTGYDEAHDIIAVDNGSFTITGNSTYGKAMLIKSDSTGNTGCNENAAPFSVSTTLITSASHITNVSNASFSEIGYLTSNGVMGSDSTLCTTVGIEAVESDSHDFKMYPNPASTTVFIETNQPITNGTIEIMDIFGNRLYVANLTNKKHSTISVNDFADGIYFVNVITKNEVSVSKLIIQHD